MNIEVERVVILGKIGEKRILFSFFEASFENFFDYRKSKIRYEQVYLYN